MTRASRRRVGLAACFHETNTFASRPTDLDAFRAANGWHLGPELTDAYVGTRTVMGGMLDAAAEHDVEVAPLLGALATPAGMVTRDAFDEIVTRLLDGLARTGPLDGLLLELHGAMVVDGDPDPETTLLQAIRDWVGELPIAVVTDLHANVTPERVALVDVLVGYRTNPHVDTYERGHDAAGHLARILDGNLRTTLLHQPVPVLAAPIAQRTESGPLSRLLAEARALEQRHGLVDVTVHGGYAYADVPHAGVSFTVTAPETSAAPAEEALALLAELAWTSREGFATDLPDTEAAVDLAVQLLGDTGEPVAITDTGDNINGGGPGDTTDLLRAVMRRSDQRVAATLWDPDAVRTASAAGVGGRIQCALGGNTEELGGGPIVVAGHVRHLGDGAFVNTGPMARGRRVSMGPTAVVQCANAEIVLQSHPVQPNDPELFRSVGIAPEAPRLVLLKGAAAVRAGWGPIVGGFVDAGTPGVTDCVLPRLPYREASDRWPLTSNEAPATSAATRSATTTNECEGHRT